jgi:hypothetical protein
MPVQTHVVRAVFLVLCLSMLTLQHGCSNSGSGQAEAPASNANAVQLALSTPNGSTAVMADGRSTIPLRLQATNGSGAAMAGVPVTFATTAGALSGSPVVRVSRDPSALTAATRADNSGSVTVTTDTNGVAQVLLTASTTAGTAVVTADALGFRTHIDILFVPGPVARVQLNASPNTVNVSGTSTLTATVTDANGNPIPGETVTFTLSTNTSGASLSATSGTTDSNGQMTVQYTAGATAGADTVRVLATSTSVPGSTSITVTSPSGSPGPGSQPPGPVNSLVLHTISNTTIGVRGSGTNETSNLTFEARDSNGNLASGTVVSFTLDSGGLGGGESLSPLQATTATNGQVTTTLMSGTKAGTVKVIAFVDANGNGLPDGTEIASQAISVVVTGGPPWGENLSMAVRPLNIAGLITFGLTDTITVFLSDRFSNPVPDGTAVSFFSDFAGITGAAVSNSSGGTTASTATATLTSQGPLPSDGFVTVAASTLSGPEARVLSLAVNPTNANVVYAGTDGGGIFRTTNGLNTNAAQVSWTQVGRAQTGLTNGIVRALQIDPISTNIVYAATDAGVFRSTGSGDTWEKLPLNTSHVTALALDSTNTSILYAGSQGGGVFRSIDSGVHWMQINSGLGDTNVISLVALSLNTLYAGTFGGGVFRTFNATDTIATTGRLPIWCQVNTGLTSTVINTLATDSNRTNVYAGTFLAGIFFLKSGKPSVEPTDCSTAPPSTWMAPTTNVNTLDTLNGFVSDIVADPNNPAILYAATLGDGTGSIEGNAAEGGVFRSIDSGGTWTRIPTLPATQLALPPADLPNNRAASLGLSAANSDALYVGVAGRNVVRLTPSTAIFTGINGTPPNQLTNNIFATTTVF